jgi:Spy/CpxP family protein refolding chaperone
MKKIILSTMLSVICQVAVLQTVLSQAHGNNKTKNHTPEQRADMHVKKMTQDLNLTSDQAPKVKSIMLDKIQKRDALKAKYANSTDKKAMHQEMKTLRDQKESELKAVLTPEQYNKHLQMREQEKQKRMQDKKNGHPGDDDDDEGK